MNEIIPIIENKDGINVVSSRTIAEQLNKRHSDVLESIESIINSENGNFRFLENKGFENYFIKTTYKVQGQIRKYKEYLLTKDGFILYMFNIQGYNDFKIAYIEEFNRMKQTTLLSLEQRLAKIESIFYPHKHKQLLIVGNHISEFLDFYKSNEIIGVPTFIVYNDYLDYCNNRKIRAVTKTKFTQTLGRLANLHTTTTKYKGKSVRIYN